MVISGNSAELSAAGADDACDCAAGWLGVAALLAGAEEAAPCPQAVRKAATRIEETKLRVLFFIFIVIPPIRIISMEIYSRLGIRISDSEAVSAPV